MALILCRDCQGKVSTNAKACRHCGAPMAMAGSTGNSRQRELPVRVLSNGTESGSTFVGNPEKQGSTHGIELFLYIMGEVIFAVMMMTALFGALGRIAGGVVGALQGNLVTPRSAVVGAEIGALVGSAAGLWFLLWGPETGLRVTLLMKWEEFREERRTRKAGVLSDLFGDAFRAEHVGVFHRFFHFVGGIIKLGLSSYLLLIGPLVGSVHASILAGVAWLATGEETWRPWLCVCMAVGFASCVCRVFLGARDFDDLMPE